MKFSSMSAPFAMLAALSIGSAVQAQEAPSAEDIASIEGTFYGTFFCSETGEMAISLMLEDGGAVLDSGAYAMKGVLSFSATAANPTAPSGVFRVSGGATIAGPGFAAFELAPGEWIEQPEGFGASGLEFFLREGFIAGMPTAGGCSSLTMQRVPG